MKWGWQNLKDDLALLLKLFLTSQNFLKPPHIKNADSTAYAPIGLYSRM
jgi:hypothetical protein